MIPGVGERLRQARRAASARFQRSLNQTAMAELVSAELVRLRSAERASQTQWSDWEREIREPPAIVCRATARVSGLDERWIAFGDADADEAPAADVPAPLTPLLGRKLPDAEVEERALRGEAKERARRKASGQTRRPPTR